MIVGYHIIFGSYGFWLPNDPRGSWSEYVGSWELYRYGSATKTTARHSVAYRPHNHKLRLAAKRALKRPAVQFTGIQARAVGRGFATYFEKSNTPVWACAILPDHVHLVTGTTAIPVHPLAMQLKSYATRQLLAEDLHPFGKLGEGCPANCFARGEWKVFLEAEHVPRAVQYVQNNPLKEGKPLQSWPFVTPYES
jgi:REP element-mobilizing transposase RayT